MRQKKCDGCFFYFRGSDVLVMHNLGGEIAGFFCFIKIVEQTAARIGIYF